MNEMQDNRRDGKARSGRFELTHKPKGRSRRPSPSGAEKSAAQSARAPSAVNFPMTCAQVWQTGTRCLQKFCLTHACARPTPLRTRKTRANCVRIRSDSIKRFIPLKVSLHQVLDKAGIALNYPCH